MADDSKFWMIWSPQGRAPTAKHLSKGDAYGEAARLASMPPYNQFYVLKAVALVDAEKPKIRRKKLKPTSGEQCIPY